MNDYKYCKPSVMVGKTISEIKGLACGSYNVCFIMSDGTEYEFYHSSEGDSDIVTLNDFEGDVSELIGGTVLSAEEVEGVCDEPVDKDVESYTWSFYKIETTKGGLWMRWFGESNGFYSEEVDFCEIKSLIKK